MQKDTLTSLPQPVGEYDKVALTKDGRIVLVKAVNEDTIDVHDYFKSDRGISHGTQTRLYLDIWEALKPHTRTSLKSV